MVEALGDRQILLLARQSVEVGETLIHAAVLVAEHGLHLCVGKAGVSGDGPVAELPGHLERLLVAALSIHVEQAGKDLVQRVVRRPHGLLFLDPVKEFFRKGAQVAGRELRLARGETRHQRLAFLLEPLVAGAGVHQRAGREVVTDEMAAHLALGLLPAAVGSSRRGQPRIDAEGVQQPVHVQRQQILLIQVLRVLERPVEQAHLAKWKRLRLKRNLVTGFDGEVSNGGG